MSQSHLVRSIGFTSSIILICLFSSCSRNIAQSQIAFSQSKGEVDFSYFPEIKSVELLKNIESIEEVKVGPYVEDFSFLLSNSIPGVKKIDFSYSNFEIKNLSKILELNPNLKKISLSGLQGDISKISFKDQIIKLRTVDTTRITISNNVRFEYEEYLPLSSNLIDIPSSYFKDIPIIKKHGTIEVSGTINQMGFIEEIESTNIGNPAKKELLTNFLKSSLVFSDAKSSSPFTLNIKIVN